MLALVEPKLLAPQQAVAKFIPDIKADITTATPIAPPPGGGTIALVLVRYATDVLFGRSSTADAGTKFVGAQVELAGLTHPDAPASPPMMDGPGARDRAPTPNLG